MLVLDFPRRCLATVPLLLYTDLHYTHNPPLSLTQSLDLPEKVERRELLNSTFPQQCVG